MNKKSLLMTAAILIVLGLGSFMFLNGSKPDSVCVPANSPSSGFVDPDKDNCPISIESYEEISDYNSKPKMGRIAGLILMIGGVAVGVVGLTRKASKADITEE